MAPAGHPPAARRIGRYTVHGEIASGGMATVHLGRLAGPGGFARIVAIKALHPQFATDASFSTMLVDEARTAARVRHPNVAQTLDVVTEARELFLVFEYVHGESLAKLLRLGDARVPPAIACAIVAGALHGLHAAHEATDEHGSPLGIVHRDVSPPNVIVGADGVARVLDFGIARAAGRLTTTRTDQVKGKIGYMAPEQVRGAAVSRGTDVYGASVVLWEALTGQRLFGGDNQAEIVDRVLAGTVPPPSKHVPGLSPELDKLVLTGLARSAGKRFATAREMALALEAHARLATPLEVGDWVMSLAKDRLASLEAEIAELEGTRVRPDAPVSAARAGSPRPTGRRQRPFWIAVLGGLAAAAVITMLFHRRRPPPSAAPLAIASSSAVSPVGTNPSSEATATPIAEPTPVTSAAAPHAVRSAHPAPRGDHCDPPYVVDAFGGKKYKLECL